MKTVDKALGLLSHFTVRVPELGLTDLARTAELDKATTLRLLTSLRKHGLVEQNPSSKKYRLGGALLRFARTREASFPMMTVVQPVLARLAAATEETAHGTLASGDHLITVGNAEPDRTARVYIDPAQELPYHATASGLAYLAFSPPDVAAAHLSKKFKAYTERTFTSAKDVAKALEHARGRGYAVAMRSFEAEVISVAAPVFDWSGFAVGAVSVACIVSRWKPEREREIAVQVLRAATEVTRGIGGEPHRDFLAAAHQLTRD